MITRRAEPTDGLTGMFSEICTVEADTSRVPRTPLRGKRGIFYRREFEIILSFGLTELKAQLSWKEDVRSSLNKHAPF